MVYNPEEEEVIWTVELACGSISVVCCLFITVCYSLFVSLRGYEFRLILYLTLSDMIASIMYMIPPSGNDHVCSFQGTMLSFATNLRLSFSLLMTIYLHFTHKASEDKIKENENFCLLIVFIISSIFAGVPFITNSYGNADGLCWIRVNRDNYFSGTLMRFGLFYVPLWIVIIYTHWVYYLMIQKIKDLRRSSILTKSFAESTMRKLRLYPAILAIGWLPASINRIIEIFDPEFKNLYLSTISLGLIAGLGFFNALAYGFTPEVRDVLMRSCLRKDITSPLAQSSVATLNSTHLNKN
jgi:hypothetical protein